MQREDVTRAPTDPLAWAVHEAGLREHRRQLEVLRNWLGEGHDLLRRYRGDPAHCHGGPSSQAAALPAALPAARPTCTH